jgi:sugar fermentation stimulation protein A
MHFPVKLRPATLLRRYKRFLADVRLENGQELTIHCPNSGSMRSCSEPGSPICYSTSDNPKRKYPQTLEMVHNGTTWIGVNTSRTNAVVTEALEQGRIEELKKFDRLRREVQTSGGSRLDIMLEQGGKKTYVEVKNCSLVEDGCALFPDAITSRGTKHLLELARLVSAGHAGVIFFLVQRLDGHRFSPAAAIDPLYARTLSDVVQRGVKILVYQARVTPDSIEVVRPLPVMLDLKQ